MLKETGDSLTIGLESTGTYGEAVRLAMTEAALEVHRISGKASSDYKEIFDGVPSQHDGKDAAIIAELTCYGKGTPWPFEPRSEIDQEIRHQLQRLDVFDGHATGWAGRLEAVLAKHWPELPRLLSLKSTTLINLILQRGIPKSRSQHEHGTSQDERYYRVDAKAKSLTLVRENTRSSIR